jgi:hypothetical protein
MGATDQDVSEDIFVDLPWKFSKSSGIIQLTELPSLTELYLEQTTTSAVGSVWKEHHRNFAMFLQKFSPRSVLEIGGAHGILSVEFDQLSPGTHWKIIEPNPAPVEGCKADFVPMFFDSETKLIRRSDVVVHSHTLEHIYSPMEFLSNIASQMEVNQLMIFSIPDLKSWFLKGHANSLNLEHTFLLTFEVAKEMLARCGFSIIEFQYFRGSHSIFVASKYIGVPQGYKVNNFVSDEDYPKIFLQNIAKKKTFAQECNQRMLDRPGNYFVYGAHIFSQQLFNLGLDMCPIKGVLDNDIQKVGRRHYGSNLKIFSPDHLSQVDQPSVILDAGEYTLEILNQLKSINPEVELLQP